MQIPDSSLSPFDIWRKRTLFACKRGNIETELLLLAFIQQLNPITNDQQRLIDAFLNENEQDLFHWLIKPIKSPRLAHHSQAPQNYHGLISEIQQVYLKIQ
ncbi:hypothetical protein THMIRHAS_14150 [Thiosulfatimonas sediminis]|uniref:FAD assembly factor SdhE n=1 Tax=Thiosulfatimonas sediminis TaxID=2675054 RepID=A0A6F8PV70_9GAMM|nr:succinate dehydrogenase assembly factor 2 [Thiosulfatimonas sediminis]BBP46042.1 hypothetical protein THMIRHAS_14150 [Thiosulfatimonas sediminis]